MRMNLLVALLNVIKKITELLRASHFGPTVLVVTITFFLSQTLFSIGDSLYISLAILFGQFVVGWSNDLIDLPLDKDAKRIKKPLVAGTISEGTLRISILLASISAIVASLISPLGVKGSAIHFLGLLSAIAYNLKLKSTRLSVFPYRFATSPWGKGEYQNSCAVSGSWRHCCFTWRKFPHDGFWLNQRMSCRQLLVF
jgi:4-hydroxybenzoate polyprenyltransferase